MPVKKAVFLKQSGELLERAGAGGHWAAVSEIAGNIAEAYEQFDASGIAGLSIVPGAGNMARGDTLRAQGLADRYADVIGRWGTLGNAIVLASALEKLQVPVQLFISDRMAYSDEKINVQVYSPDRLAAAHKEGKIALLAGGCGLDHVTTDYAVAFYANDYRRVFKGDILVLKSTKFDGVYEADPANSDSMPRRFSLISAQTIQKDYERFKVVDEPSLAELIKGRLSMFIYSDASHSLKEVLSAGSQPSFGTIITTEEGEPRLAD